MRNVFEVDENVCKLKVSVQNIHVMESFEALDNLTHKISSFLLAKFASDLSQFVEVSSVAVLSEKVEVVLSLLDVVKTYHIWTLDLAQDAYFTFQVHLQSLV